MKEQTTQAARFKYMREEVLNLTQAQLAKKLDTTQQIIAFIENGRKQKIDTDILYKLVTDYLINTEWLLFGTGDITKVDTEERIEYKLSKQDSNVIPIPYYEVKAAAGEGCENVDYPDKDVVYFDKRWLKAAIGRNPEHLSLIIADGDSMVPDIQSGDLLMVDDTIKEVIPNKVFVIKQDGKDRVKKLKRDINGDIYVVSNNPKYEAEPIDRETFIIGQVVWNGSKENV